MKTLCFNTSDSLAEISLIDDNQTKTEYVAGPHSEKLMTKVDELLTANNLMITDIDCFSVVVGPGSFTGIRIAVASVKGVCVVTSPKLVSINNFDLVAFNVNDDKFLVVLESGNEDKYTALYENGICKKICCRNNEQILEYINSENIKAYADLSQKEKLELDIDYIELNKTTLVELTKQKIQSGEFVGINDLAPLYVKLSQAERVRSEKILAEMEIVKAENVAKLMEIESQCFSFDAFSEQTFKEELSLENKYYYLAKWQGKNIGYIGFETNIDDMSLQKVAVLEDYRNCGVATKLLEFSLEQKQLLKKDRYFLEVDENNQNALKLYQKLGFEVISKREKYYKNGDACLLMEYKGNK